MVQMEDGGRKRVAFNQEAARKPSVIEEEGGRKRTGAEEEDGGRTRKMSRLEREEQLVRQVMRKASRKV